MCFIPIVITFGLLGAIVGIFTKDRFQKIMMVVSSISLAVGLSVYLALFLLSVDQLSALLISPYLLGFISLAMGAWGLGSLIVLLVRRGKGEKVPEEHGE